MGKELFPQSHFHSLFLGSSFRGAVSMELYPGGCLHEVIFMGLFRGAFSTGLFYTESFPQGHFQWAISTRMFPRGPSHGAISTGMFPWAIPMGYSWGSFHRSFPWSVSDRHQVIRFPRTAAQRTICCLETSAAGRAWSWTHLA